MEPIYDVLAVGLGPAALAVGIALVESNSRIRNGLPSETVQPSFSSLGGLQEALTSNDNTGLESSETGNTSSSSTSNEKELSFCSIELQPQFTWHAAMLIEGARMQISFLKDLATLRDPTSSYTFISYLHSFSPSRLLSFISIAQFAPLRVEFADYLSWCAKKMEQELLVTQTGSCGFGEAVLRIDAVLEEEIQGEVGVLEVTSKVLATGEIKKRRARNVILSTGGQGKLPRDLESIAENSTQVIHSSKYLDKIDPILNQITTSLSSSLTTSTPSIKLAVIGAGQSAAEIFINLRSTLASYLALQRCTNFDPSNRPEIHIFIRRGALRPADDCAFSNEVFDPGMSQKVYRLDEGGRRILMEEARNTNYSVVNPETLAAIYEAMYSQKVEEDISISSGSTKHFSDPKLIIHPYSDISFASLSPEDQKIELLITNSITQSSQKYNFDAVFCGTGYNRQGWKDILFPAPKSTTTGTSNQVDEEISKVNISLGELFQHDEPRKSSFPLSTAFTTVSTSSSRPITPTSLESLTSSSSSDTSPDRYSSDSVHTAASSLHFSTSETMADTQLTKSRAVDYKIQENYRLVLPSTFSRGEGKKLGVFRPTFWVQGSNEAQFGISDSLLSVLAVRSGEVVKSLRKEGWFGNV